MTEPTTTQTVLFPNLFDKPLVARFDQPHGSSDGGAILLKAADQRLGLTARLAACQAGDRVWRLPILADYRVLLRSQIADLRNAEYGEAGTILGGMFIGEFVRGKPWVHLDIAASSWNTNSELTTVLRGPSGAGTRLCIELAELISKGAR